MNRAAPLPACALALLAAACTVGRVRIEKLPVSPPNPTSFVFDLPVEEVQRRGEAAFSAEHQAADPVFPRTKFEVETRESASFSDGLLKKEGNEHDLYLHNFLEPIWPSPVYRGNGKGLPFTTAFHVHLAPAGEGRSRVDVIAMAPTVLNGTTFGFGPCAPGWSSEPESVEPTTIEEYVVLRYLGRALGREDMPEVVLPAETR